MQPTCVIRSYPDFSVENGDFSSPLRKSTRSHVAYSNSFKGQFWFFLCYIINFVQLIILAGFFSFCSTMEMFRHYLQFIKKYTKLFFLYALHNKIKFLVSRIREGRVCLEWDFRCCCRTRQAGRFWSIKVSETAGTNPYHLWYLAVHG